MTSDGYTSFRDESELNRRLLLQEELILEVTEAIAAELEHRGMLKKDLAEKLGKTKGYISQILGGGKNLTLRTLADIADALQCTARITLDREEKCLASHPDKAPILKFSQDDWGCRGRGFNMSPIHVAAPQLLQQALGSA